MIFDNHDVTPADYYVSESGDLTIDPYLREAIHCDFVTTLKTLATKENWTLHMFHTADRNSGFPGVAVSPPDQPNKKILRSYRIESGLPDILDPEDAAKPYVGHSTAVYEIQQRVDAGPLSMYLPVILSEKRIITCFLGGQAGMYDPANWAELTMKLLKVYHERHP